jgi:hypothetical protein
MGLLNILRSIFIGLPLILTLGGCGQAEREAKIKQLPGYPLASQMCAKCHAAPYPPDRPAEVWPGIVTRMEGLMRNRGQTPPDQATHDALVQYFVTGAKM